MLAGGEPVTLFQLSSPEKIFCFHALLSLKLKFKNLKPAGTAVDLEAVLIYLRNGTVIPFRRQIDYLSLVKLYSLR